MEAEGSRWETADIKLMPRQGVETNNKQLLRELRELGVVIGLRDNQVKTITCHNIET